ncbi:MAG: hypothetical protein GF418_12795 [Chitinivibrionales bacterium]|nr:hypothetical protein [Chitinivibrionales bacterium]MBD3396498.1 hypothetical protein [Chitinivibrionales bacterium]
MNILGRKSITRLARSIITNARDFVYPPLCILCDNPLSKNDPWFCDACIDKLNANASGRNACPRCSQDRARHACACHLVWDHPYERVYSLFDFDETVQAVAHQVKYRGKKSLAFHVGKRYARLVPPEFLEGIDAAVAIPLHFRRKMKRGYNQAEYLAKGVLAGHGNSIPYLGKALKRTRHTRTQTKLDREQREKNLKGAFGLNPGGADAVRGKNLMLVDDVVTTGATTAHCTRILLEEGALSVRVLSLARD